MDIASAHTKALLYTMEGRNTSNCEVFNLGSGNGVTVLELINSFEKISQQKLNYKIGPRRAGDVIAVYADNSKAQKELGWQPEYSQEEMMDTAWRWELTLRNESQVHLN